MKKPALRFVQPTGYTTDTTDNKTDAYRRRRHANGSLWSPKLETTTAVISTAPGGRLTWLMKLERMWLNSKLICPNTTSTGGITSNGSNLFAGN